MGWSPRELGFGLRQIVAQHIVSLMVHEVTSRKKSMKVQPPSTQNCGKYVRYLLKKENYET